ncbi:MAG TPA: hypothetical protein VK629_13765 [Steroidobacteraceae bacterium]|nr:hypothetical protein [Steroidobacteraceae bacterium]
MKTKKLYSPLQAWTAAFVGGPLAAIYVLKSNYAEMGWEDWARFALRCGYVFVGVLCVIVPFLPERFPNVIIPVAYTIAAWQIVERHQLSKEAITQSEHFDFQPNARVAWVCLGSLFAFFVLISFWMILLDATGVISLEEFAARAQAQGEVQTAAPPVADP